MAIRDLLTVQVGTEAASDEWGTERVPTAKLMGIQSCEITPIVETQVFDEIRGSLQPGFESALAREAGEASLAGILTFEDIPYMLDALFGTKTATENVGDTDYYDRIWTAPGASYSSDHAALRYMTIVYGDANSASDAYSLVGSTLQSLNISGGSNAPLTWSADFIGKEAKSDTLASLSDRDVNVAMGNHVALYMDAIGGTAGSTQISNIAFAFSLDINTNRGLKHHLGALTPTAVRDQKWQGTLSLTLELDSTSRAFLDPIVLASAVQDKVIRIKATSGSYVFQFDFAGVITQSPSIYTDNDGVVTVELTYNGIYNSVQASFLDMLVTNITSALA